MRYVLIATLAAGCSSNQATPSDLSTAAADMAVPDMSPAPPAPCDSPRPGIYGETVQYTYAPIGGGQPMFSTYASTVIVRNSGAFERPLSAIYSPTQFHCGFSAVDPQTCTAPCCPGQVSSPTLYFDRGGWTTWMAGACSFQTTTAATYAATITDAEGTFSR